MEQGEDEVVAAEGKGKQTHQYSGIRSGISSHVVTNAWCTCVLCLTGTVSRLLTEIRMNYNSSVTAASV